VAEYEQLTPFAIVGSNTVIKTSDGRTIRARQYRWGVVEVENPQHSDFVKLRELLIRYVRTGPPPMLMPFFFFKFADKT